MPPSTIQKLALRRVLYFLVLLVILTLTAFLVTASMRSTPLASLLIMWTPALAALLAGLLTRRPIRDIGWGLRPVRWLAIGWLIPVLYGSIAYGLLWITGLGGIPNPTFIERARLTLNMPDAGTILLIAAAFGYITLVNLLPGMLMSLGEEIGWRGFLVPELANWGGFQKAALYSGGIWFLWHLPGILSGDYGATGTPLAFRLLCFATLVISGGVIFAWLRIRSGSIWPAVVMHAVHNNVIQAFFDRITFDTGYTKYLAGEFGIALVLVNLVLAWLCWRQLGRQSSEVTAAPEMPSLREVDW
ncbi:MAG: CPBP family intramembrane glutamic endopeptidase [Bacteroidota bacterium]